VLSGTSWSQQAELTSTAQTPNDAYGSAVAVWEDTAVVGAQDTPPWPNPAYGAVYVFGRSGSTWSQQAELLDPQYGSGQNHFFGAAVAVQGTTLVVGAVGATGVTTDTGAAYIYGRVGNTWLPQARLIAADGAYVDGFGASVAISGSTILVGAPGKDNGEGAVYVFVRSGGTWSQQAELLYPGHVLNAEFGNVVALGGDTALVGAPLTPVAFLYGRSGTTWTLQAVLSTPHSPLSFFGDQVALWGDTALVSACCAQPSVNGAVYVFGRSGSTWALLATLTPPDGTTNFVFGTALALSYHTAVVGGEGAAVYVGSGGTWRRQAQLRPTDRPPTAIGSTVAVQGNTALIGATGTPPAGYVFVRTWADATGEVRADERRLAGLARQPT
jgi:hypothetical protein